MARFAIALAALGLAAADVLVDQAARVEDKDKENVEAKLATFAGVYKKLTNKEKQAILQQHNIYRCMHEVPPMTWDDDVAANAQAWADGGVYRHSDRILPTGARVGENLAWGFPSYSGVESVMAWYNEIRFTSPLGLSSTGSDTTTPGEPIGHYTQVVWRSSTKLGCGKGRSFGPGDRYPQGDYWVCQYSPAGNYAGRFDAEVTAPVKPVTECNGTSQDLYAQAPASMTGAAPEPALPSSCVPRPLMPHGSLCVYGFQCASSFCCPRLRVCLRSSSAGLSSADLGVSPGLQETILDIVFRDGATCRNPWGDRQACMQTSAGQPLRQWDQSRCGCKAEYMTRYQAGTWVTLNAGVTCGGDGGGVGSGAPGETTTEAASGGDGGGVGNAFQRGSDASSGTNSHRDGSAGNLAGAPPNHGASGLALVFAMGIAMAAGAL